MRVVTKDEFKLNEELFLKDIKKGKVYIHPTDTIYGIGCNALDRRAVNKIRKAKQRKEQPFSIIAPSKDWIFENCIVGEKEKEHIDKLPGPYTLILKLKNKKAIAKNVAPGLDSVGIRIPDHWFSNVSSKVGVPLITTSANKVGENFMTSIEDLDFDIKNKMHYFFNEGEKIGRPSKIIHLDKDETKIQER